ncbi:hypothetical protein AB6D02_20630 [Vibrio splendidus]
MNTRILSNLSLLVGTLSKPLSTQMASLFDLRYPRLSNTAKIQFVNIYASFLYIQELKNFSGTGILNDKVKFQEHLDNLIGFIYAEQEGAKLATIRTFSKPIHSTMSDLAKANNIHISAQTFGSKKVTEYVQECISKYQLLSVNAERLAYLGGWMVTSQKGEDVLINLDFLYTRYGRSFTDKIHDAVKRYGLTQKTNSLETRIRTLLYLLEVASGLDRKSTVETFELLLSASNVQSTFYKAYQIQLSECICKGNDLVQFNRDFITSLDLYNTVFINTKLYSSPLKPFIKPKVLKLKNPPSLSSGGKPSELEKTRWFADIPLQIKDEQAIEIIETRICRDMAYLRAVLTNHFNELKERQERNKDFIERGLIRPLTGKGGAAINEACKVGENNIENTVATFYQYGIGGGPSSMGYEFFLGFTGKTPKLLKELNLPTNATLFTLTVLLVMEHPKITPAWLQKLQLFNEHGKRQGYLQVGRQFILSSEKERRGSNLAQQDVVLNDFSKSIVDYIIVHTEFAREHLKSIHNPNWKYLLLTCSLDRVSKPSRATALYKNMPFLIELLKEKFNIASDHSLTLQDVSTIASITTHRAIRRHRGLQIYLETRSQSAVADALGHKETQSELLASYLPKPLMDFFTERVVRQFQKAIILKAMEKSPYVLDAVNMSYEQIEEFMENHGLNDIPDLNIESFNSVASKVDQSLFENIVFTVTVPLIQLLISIKTILDSENDESNFNDLVQHWYQSACYLLKRFEMGDFSDSDEIEEIYREARDNQLNNDVIKGVISC